MTDYIHAIVHFAEAHANWVYVIAFLAALLESVAVLGFLVPGSGIIVAIGALIPSGAVGFWWLCLWSILGALGGDSISYWVGHHYGDQLRRVWPFSRYPQVLAHGERFFARHGGKSVFLARFVAPVRGAVPLVAGLARLSPGRFLVANATSALGWAPAHIIPGMLIGAGLTLTNAVATRLLVFAVLLALVLWIAARITVLAIRRGLPVLTAAQERIDAWARGRRGWFAQHVLALVDPDLPEARTLAVLGIIVLGAAWMFLAILEDVATGDPLVRADTAIYNLLQGLRNLVADRVMIAITELGGVTVGGAVTAVVLLWLLWHRAWRTAVYWIAAVGGASLIGMAIKIALHRPRPAPVSTGWDIFSFPSGHATASAAIYGFLAVLLARRLAPAWQALIGALAVLMVALTGFSRLYLGAHWFSDVIGGIAFGTAWVALLSIAYVRHNPPKLPPLQLALIVIVTLATVGSFQVERRMTSDLQRYAVHKPERSMAAVNWWRGGWRDVAARRVDLIGEQEEPMILQWGGSLGDLRNVLTADGWHTSPSWSIQSAITWLGPVANPLSPPVLPRLHDGRSAALTLIHGDGDENHRTARYVLRVWSTSVRLTGPDGETHPLWTGAITLQRFGGLFAPFSVAFEQMPPTAPWPLLKEPLPASGIAMRADEKTGRTVLLAYDPAHWQF